MPLGGSGTAMGTLVLAAMGNFDPAAPPVFGAMGDALGGWLLKNMKAMPGSMMAAGASVAGAGAFVCPDGAVSGSQTLGPALATAVGDPSENGITTWTKLAKALIQHFQTFGQISPASFVVSNPTTGGPLTGFGNVMFTNMVLPVAPAIGVSDAAASAMLTIFGAQILAHIQTVAQVSPVPIGLPPIPFTAPPGGGPITGSGSIL
jgi:hypothetical protein